MRSQCKTYSRTLDHCDTEILTLIKAQINAGLDAIIVNSVKLISQTISNGQKQEAGSADDFDGADDPLLTY